MLRVVLSDPTEKRAIHFEDTLQETRRLTGEEVFLVTTDVETAHGVFQNVTTSGAGTTTVITPNDAGSLLLTDLILSTDKVNSGTVTLQMTDDTNTITLFQAIVTDAPAVLSMPINGRIQGWKDARIDLVIVNNVDVSVTLGYVKMPSGLPFTEWDELR